MSGAREQSSGCGEGRVRTVRLVTAGLFLAVVLLYARSIGFDYVRCDDDLYVFKNPPVLEGLSPDGVAWAFTSRHEKNWIPLTWLSFMADAGVSGPRPGWMHAVNALLHAANAAVLFRLLFAMTSSLWRSAMVAALFALHPLNVEAVAWITSRKDVLSTFFGLLSLLAYVRWTRARGPWSGAGFYGASIVLYACSLLAKQMLMTLPAILLLIHFWPLRRVSGNMNWKRILLETAPFFALAAGAAAMAVWGLSGPSDPSVEPPVPLESRAINALMAYALYPLKMLWPSRLVVFCPAPSHWPAWQVLGAFVLVAGFTAGAIAHFAASGKRAGVFGWLWYAAALFPVCGLIPVGDVFMADRWGYVPLIGLFIALVWGAGGMGRRPGPPRRVLPWVSAGVLCALAAASWIQIGHWRDGLTLFSHAARVAPGNHLCRYNLGCELHAAGKPDSAVREFREVVAIKPDFADAWDALGVSYGALGRHEDAVAAYEKALLRRPNHPAMHRNLGLEQLRAGDLEKAAGHLQAAARLRPNWAEAHIALGHLAVAGKAPSGALRHYREAARLEPGAAEPRFWAGAALLMADRIDEAVREFEKAVEMDPAMDRAHANLGAAWARLGDKTAARKHSKIALQLNPDNRVARRTLEALGKE